MFPPVPELLVKICGNSYAIAASVLYGTLGFFLLLVLLIAWLILGRGPRRRRKVRLARRQMKEGHWEEAVETVRKARTIGSPSASWQRRFDQLEGECHQVAYQQSLGEKEYEEALERGL